VTDAVPPNGSAGGAPTHPPGGHRRIDRVLASEFTTDLAALPLADVRARRHDAEQEETDLSYIRRMLQGRIDIVRAELARRSGEGGASLVDALPRILADDARGGARGLGRHATAEPSRADAHRRYVEALVADVDVSDVGSRSDEELASTLETFEREERDISTKRRAVQQVMDACAAEIARRYRDGEADVADILDSGPA
jgi:hypothetical protein